MLRLLIISILFLVPPYILLSQDELQIITIKIFSESVYPTEDIYIVGNNRQLGNWQPDSVKLNFVNDHWERTFKFRPNTSIEFKFTKGSWANEALDENGNIPSNHLLKIQNDTTLVYRIEHWKDGFAGLEIDKQITGDVIYHKQMTFDSLLPRDVIVWLPPNYYIENKKHYPVLYMHDGQNLFDPTTSFTNTDWQLDETADSLINNSNIEPVIIVGVYNTKDRSEEYSLTDKGIKYMQFIVSKLKPFIDKTYRTLPDRKNTAVGGSSSGGLISMMLAWKFSAYFSKVACFSPAFKYNDIDFPEAIKKHKGIKKDLLIYIDNGGKGVDELLQPGVEKMIEVLQKQSFNISEDLFVDIDSTADHTESAWAKRIHQPLKLFFPKEISKNEIESIEQFKESDENKRDIRNNRFRIQGAAVSTLENKEVNINLPVFLNLNYRFSNIDSIGLNRNFSYSFSAEPGVNVYFNEPMFLPYIKIGPEFRVFRNLYFDTHIGLTVINIALTYPIPFYGAEIGYILNLSDDFSVEFELGFNGIHPFYIYYFGIAFSF